MNVIVIQNFTQNSAFKIIYNFAGLGDVVAFNIAHFDKDSKIAEHLDIIEPIGKMVMENFNC